MADLFTDSEKTTTTDQEKSEKPSWEKIKEDTKYEGKCVPDYPKYTLDLCYEDVKPVYHIFMNCLFN